VDLRQEEQNKKKGMVISVVIHSLLLLILLTPFLVQPEIIQTEGILVAFGDPDAGSDDLPMEEVENVSAPAPAPSNEIDNITSKTKTEEAPIKVPDKKPEKNKPNTIKNESDAKAKAHAEADAKAKAERDRLAAEKARAEKEAAEKAAAAANQKKKYSDLLGKGKGNNNTSGNQGTNAGDPDGKALDGISKGTGRVGGGLAGRGVQYAPTFTDNSQKTGKVSLAICVNSSGKVVSADFTQKGSTTSDSYLIDLAKKTAMKYRFSNSDADSQCGTVTIDFKVQ
jgi:membrane protein involved in colicin uptake